ncbi:response regulator [Pullulanibacillus sp. KACC 23026]|uniref:response regulator transcription factor n=1 Tax=Pullulanibacillus sp. KACC 23026 TaxID=3028315 RepID=UPI0023B0C00F|nr:response regulator [Pullulanibacillus sp. KACC 23026]WEG11740.1 response regulator [Pullulanibacillus sp. KACC 23026]
MLNLMIVDDEPLIVKGLMKIIQNGNTPWSEIESASDGVDALEKLDHFKPDLLITDIQMPEMSGFELINEFRARGTCHNFVILSGFDHKSYLKQAIRCRTIDYLLKPVNKTELFNVLSNVSVELLQIKNPAKNQVVHEVENEGIFKNENANMSKNIKKIIGHIDKNYNKDLSLDEIAEHVYLHPNYISSLFKKETGLTFIQYIHLYRIKKAKELIVREPDLSFNVISEKVGYENVRHFFSVFKKYTGVTPGEYREHFKYNV